MFAMLAGVSVRWNHSLEDIMGLVFVAGVVGAYSLLFAFTRRPWLGWAITALVSFAAMATLLCVSPSKAEMGAGSSEWTRTRLREGGPGRMNDRIVTPDADGRPPISRQAGACLSLATA
jgi:hypothetical protein